MKFAIIGGTHGNELVGIEAMRALESERPTDCLYEYETFLGNPKAHELKQRFVNCDLNRTFGNNGSAKGYEAGRSAALKSKIIGNFDFLLDLHTTTSNMGLTLLINRDDDISLKAACYLQDRFEGLKLIKAGVFNEECPYTNAMVKSGLTIEVGPVANNVVKAELVIHTYNMVKELLSWDFSEDFDFSQREVYETIENYHFPEGNGWMIHPEIQDNSFEAIKKGDPVFIKLNGEVKNYEGEETVYPFFINEAAYQADRIAMTLSRKKLGL